MLKAFIIAGVVGFILVFTVPVDSVWLYLTIPICAIIFVVLALRDVHKRYG